jgi:hypothetical protein
VNLVRYRFDPRQHTGPTATGRLSPSSRQATTSRFQPAGRGRQGQRCRDSNRHPSPQQRRRVCPLRSTALPTRDPTNVGAAPRHQEEKAARKATTPANTESHLRDVTVIARQYEQRPAIDASETQVGPSHHLAGRQLLTIAFEHDSAALQHIAAVGDLQALLHVLLDEEHRYPLVAQLLDHVK